MTAHVLARPITYLPGVPEALFGIRDVRGDSACTTASMDTGAWLTGPGGHAASGSLGVLVDVAFGGSVVGYRPPGHWAVTTEISIDFCARLPVDGTVLHSQSEVASFDAGGGLARGQVQTADGRTVAVGTQRVRYVPGDPQMRLAPGTTRERRSERNLLDLLGVAVREPEGRRELALAVGPDVANPLGNVHGGVLLCVSEVAGLMAVQSEADPLESAAIRIAYLRPCPLEGDVRFGAEVAYRGRTSAVVHVRALRADGKACSVATVTCRRPD